jgi:hypothetical protein
MSDLAQQLGAVWSAAIKVKTRVTPVAHVTAGIREPTDCNARRNSYALEPPCYWSAPASYVSYGGYATKSAENGDLDAFEERAAIAEHCGGLPKAHAEVLAALHLADLGPNAERIIDAAARVLDRMAEIKRSAREFEDQHYPSMLARS